MTELEQLCGDPRKVGVTMKEAAENAKKNAKKFEKENDLVRAKAWYQIDGGLALYEDVKKVVEYFSKCEKLSGVSYHILKNPEKKLKHLSLIPRLSLTSQFQSVGWPVRFQEFLFFPQIFQRLHKFPFISIILSIMFLMLTVPFSPSFLQPLP